MTKQFAAGQALWPATVNNVHTTALTYAYSSDSWPQPGSCSQLPRSSCSRVSGVAVRTPLSRLDPRAGRGIASGGEPRHSLPSLWDTGLPRPGIREPEVSLHASAPRAVRPRRNRNRGDLYELSHDLPRPPSYTGHRHHAHPGRPGSQGSGFPESPLLRGETHVPGPGHAL